MKKTAYYMIALLMFVVTACGGGDSNENADEQSTEGTAAAGMTEYDLSQYGINATIMIPDQNTGVAEVTENEMGGVDIIVGKSFGISVLFGTGDIALLKSDLNDDLVYEATIHTDEPNLLVYEKNIPGGEMEAEFHFYYTITIDGEPFDIQNMSSTTFNKAAIDNMVAAAKTLKGKSAS